MSGDRTTVQIATATWKELNRLKEPGETFDDVIQRLLNDGGSGADKPNVAIESAPARDARRDGDPAETDADRDALPADLQAALDEYREHCEAHDAARADARVAAARAVMARMVAEDGIAKSDAQDALLPRYAVPEQSPETWWDKQGKRLLGELDCVEWVAGRNEYVYVGEEATE